MNDRVRGYCETCKAVVWLERLKQEGENRLFMKRFSCLNCKPKTKKNDWRMKL